MAEKRENSVLFSLRELKGIEEDRVREEDAAKSAREQAEMAAREAEIRRQREEAERKVRDDREAEARLQMEVERQKREEAMRLEEGERKHRVEAQMKLEEQRLKMEIEAQAVHGSKKKPTALIAVAAILFVAVAGLGFFAYSKHQEGVKAQLDAQLKQNEIDEQAKQFSKLKADSEAANADLQAAFDKKIAAKTDDEKRAADEDIAKAKARQEAATAALNSHTSGGGKPRGTAKPAGGGDGPALKGLDSFCPPDKPLCNKK